MKKLIFIFILLPCLIASSVGWILSPVIVSSPPSGAPPSTMCNGSCLADDADIYCEDNQGDCSWTSVGNISFTSTTGVAALQALCTGYSFDYVLDVNMVTGGDHYTYFAHAAASHKIDEFYINIESTDVNSGTEFQVLGSFGDCSAGLIGNLYITWDTDHLKLQISKDGAREDIGTVTTGTWYKVSRDCQALTHVIVELNESVVINDTTIAETDSSCSTIWGASSAGIGYNTRFQVGLIKTDDDTEPAVCE